MTMKRYLVAGLLVWLPLGVTLLVVRMLINWLDGFTSLLPEQYRPETVLGFAVPGLGAVLTILVVLITGIIAANFVGRRFVKAWEQLLARIPLVRSIYSASKQLTETVFSDSGQSFRQVVMVEFPRKGVWTLAFVTGRGIVEAEVALEKDLTNIYVPTTPNPTGGYFLMVPKDELIELDMSVDEGLKTILSMGAVSASERAMKLAAQPVNP